MKPLAALFLACVAATDASGQSLIATRTIPARSVLAEGDVELTAQTFPGAASDVARVVGQEIQVALYKGRPILTRHLSEPATVERNAAVMLAYRAGAVMIVTEGRALARGGTGDTIRVMNLASRTILSGRVGQDGTIHVTP